VKTISWYSPQPKRKPKRLPRRRPIKTVPSGIGDEGIVGNWLFYYLKGGDHLHDFSPENNHGDIKGAVWKDGRCGWILKFDGVDDYVDFGTNAELRNQKVTISAWVYWNELPDNYEYIVSLGYADSSSQGVKLASASDTNTYEVALYGSDGNLYNFKASSISTGQWDFMVLTYNGSALKLYRNGSQVDSIDVSVTVSYDSSVPDVLGYAPDRNARYFPGKIAIVRIYKITKSDSWISRRFERTRGIFGV